MNLFIDADQTTSATAAYIHIPFCRRRCFYCDFPISVVGERPWGEANPAIEQYLATLGREIELAQPPSQPLATVFFGGGTPSLLAPAQIQWLLEQLDRHLGIAAMAEISLEVDPGTFTSSQLSGYRAAGVNRLSLGIQSFQPELLAAAGRAHTLADTMAAVDCIRNLGWENWSLDLIAGLPGQTLVQWQQDLETAVALAPSHLSAYDLVVEPGTVFAKRYQPGDAPLPTEALTAEMYRLADQVLTTAGYRHYEISNYARPGYACRHNQVYWYNQPYYGFGMGATSYLQGQRFSRPRTRQTYTQWLESLAAGEGLLGVPTTSELETWLETLMLGLRLATGINLDQLGQQFSPLWVQHLRDCLQPYRELGWVELSDNWLALSRPEGFLFSNQVLVAIWSAFEEFAQKDLQ